MAYTAHFVAADGIVAHLNTFVPGLAPALRSQYAGFAAVSALTVYELAVKEIFIEFATKKHNVFGHFTSEHFDRINGRIGLKSLKDEHLPRFGDKYVKKFSKLLEAEEKIGLAAAQGSIKSSYGNLVTWRHGFAHGGVLPANATFAEVTRSYELGKRVIACLATAMNR